MRRRYGTTIVTAAAAALIVESHRHRCTARHRLRHQRRLFHLQQPQPADRAPPPLSAADNGAEPWHAGTTGSAVSVPTRRCGWPGSSARPSGCGAACRRGMTWRPKRPARRCARRDPSAQRRRPTRSLSVMAWSAGPWNGSWTGCGDGCVQSAHCEHRSEPSVQVEPLWRRSVLMVRRRSTVRFRKGAPQNSRSSRSF
jgi:hypothetical protein